MPFWLEIIWFPVGFFIGTGLYYFGQHRGWWGRW